ncbi:MAG: 50S ribosomal protein L10 [candidate division WOR-3 bacterium]
MVASDKVLKLEQIKKLVSDAKAIYFADLGRIKANDITDLRRKLSSVNAKVKVVKNRITKRAFNEIGLSGIESFLVGPTALILSFDDPLTPAKLIKDYSKKTVGIKIKGAFFENSIYQANQFEFLASLPSRPELIAEFIGSVQQPLNDLVFTLAGLLQQLIVGLEELKEIRSKQNK